MLNKAAHTTNHTMTVALKMKALSNGCPEKFTLNDIYTEVHAAEPPTTRVLPQNTIYQHYPNCYTPAHERIRAKQNHRFHI
jgi:hypothetical protein